MAGGKAENLFFRLGGCNFLNFIFHRDSDIRQKKNPAGYFVLFGVFLLVCCFLFPRDSVYQKRNKKITQGKGARRMGGSSLLREAPYLYRKE